MSSFRFGFALYRLLFKALKRYLLKNSSSIETVIRSLNREPSNSPYRIYRLYLFIDSPWEPTKLQLVRWTALETLGNTERLEGISRLGLNLAAHPRGPRFVPFLRPRGYNPDFTHSV